MQELQTNDRLNHYPSFPPSFARTGGQHWLNTVMLSKAVIQHYVETEVGKERGGRE